MVWLALSTLGLILGLVLTWWLHQYHQIGPQLAAHPPAPADGPFVSVIVPARNEERNIRRSVEALLAQTYPNFELIVVDDRSTDATPAILAEIAARDERLRIVAGEPLPPGWAGKPHALAQGARVAQGEWLCFVDADTFAEPTLLAAALAGAQDHQADLFTLITQQRLGTFWEKVVMPVVFSALAVGFPAERVNDPRRPEAIANGQFILIRRAVYDAVGGHERLWNSIVEDKALAEVVKHSGYRLVLADGRPFVETRMYTSLSEVWEGWTKNIYLGIRDRPGLLVFGAVTTFIGALLLPGWLAAGGLWLARGGGPPAAVVLAEALLLWAYVLRQRAEVARQLDIAPAYALTLPIGSLVFAGMMLASTARVLSGRGVQWKGRTYAG